MSVFLFIRKVGVATAIAVLHGQVVAQQSVNRDFSIYEKPPLIVLNPLASEAQYNAAQYRLRNALWSYWSKRTRAIIRVDARVKDGPAAAEVYFVEPDEHGKWSVAVETEQDRFDKFSQLKTHRSIRSRAYSIRRVEDGSDKVTRPHAKEDGSGYTLLLEDLTGKVIGTI